MAVSVDNLESHRQVEERLGGLPFPLASDEGAQTARAYGVLNDNGSRSNRAVFVIDPSGTIIHRNTWFQPGNPAQFLAIFASLGLE